MRGDTIAAGSLPEPQSVRLQASVFSVGRLVPLPTLWHFNGTRILAPQLLSKKTAILQLPAYMDLNIKNKLTLVIQIGRFGLYDDLACEPLATSYSSLKTEVCVTAEPPALLQ